MALWRAPGLPLPGVVLKHPSVSQFIVGAAVAGAHGHGADVMLPGVDTTRLPDFQKGDLVAVFVPGNPAPIAVGTAALGAGDAAAAAAAGGGRGKAVEVLQAYGDCLWLEAAGKPVPNEGFLELQVVALGGHDAAVDGGSGGGEQEAAPAAGETATRAAADEGAEAAGGGEAAGEAGLAAGGRGSAAGSMAEASEPAGSASGAPGAGDGAGAGAGDAAAGTEAQAPPADMEALLEAALLQALHKSVKDADLPLAGSMLWCVARLGGGAGGGERRGALAWRWACSGTRRPACRQR